MNILCVLFKYDYGEKKRGVSFEYNTFYRFFERQGYTLKLMDLGIVVDEESKKRFNVKLRQKLYSEKFDLVFCVPFSNQLDSSILDSPKKYKTPFVAWMCDDKWRWDAYSRDVCWMFDYVVTTDPDALEKYEKIGYKNALLSQWAFDDILKQKKIQKYLYDVSFVGQVNPWRKYVIGRLRDVGIKVECFGFGWKNGRVDEKEMRKIFANSKINLNISNSVKWDLRYLAKINLNVDNSLDIPHRILNMFPIIHTIFFPKRSEDIKARFFEVTGCGGFLLSYNVEHLDSYFEIGEEIVCYDSIDNLIAKTIYYIKNSKERKRIADNGFLRSKTEHLYKNRFNELFAKIGLR